MNKGLYTSLADDAEDKSSYLARMNAMYHQIHDFLSSGTAKRGTDDSTYDSLLLLSLDWSEQMSRWAIGDYIAQQRKTQGANKTYRFVSKAIGKSERWSLELYRVSSTFPVSMRFYGVPWQLYRVCVSAPKPVDALMSAISEGIPVSKMEQYLRKYRSLKEDRKSGSANA